MSRALESISLIASEFCEDIGDSTEFNHARFSRKLLRAYKRVNTFLSPELQIVTQVYPASGQIPLPCDFIYETKIGLSVNGILVTLDLKKDLRLSNLQYKDSDIQSALTGYANGDITPEMYYPFYNCFRGNNYLGELYGYGCGFHANTWYDIQDGNLILGSLVPDNAEVVIEYKSTGLKDGFQLVPTEMVEYMINFAKSLFYEDSAPTRAVYFMEKAKVEYQRLKRLYNTRPPEYLAWLFKVTDSPSKL